MTQLDGGGEAAVAALAALFDSGPVAVLTGAGLSTDSGIPDYRGAGSPPRTPMSISQFMDDPGYRQRFWAGASIGALRTVGIAPNAGHLALTLLEESGRIDGVITQNVDGLHRAAGSRTVMELHGAGDTIRCVSCGARSSRAAVLATFDELNPGFVAANRSAEIAPDGDALVGDAGEVRGVRGVAVPDCRVCGGVLRPDVVYFGETVPPAVFSAAEELVAGAHALLLAGTSLAVNTGVRLVHRAERRGIPLAVINRGPTAVDDRASVQVRIDGGTSETLGALARLLGAA